MCAPPFTPAQRVSRLGAPCHLQEGSPLPTCLLGACFSGFQLLASATQLRGECSFQGAATQDCSTRALTHAFLSLRVYFSSTFLEEETRTRSRILWEEPGALWFSLGAPAAAHSSGCFRNPQPRAANWLGNGCARFKKTRCGGIMQQD